MPRKLCRAFPHYAQTDTTCPPTTRSHAITTTQTIHPVYVDSFTDPPCLVDESASPQTYIQEEVEDKIEFHGHTRPGVVYVADAVGPHGEHQQREVRDSGLLVGGMSCFVLENEGAMCPTNIVRHWTFERDTINNYAEQINVQIHSAAWANGGNYLVLQVEWDGGAA